MAPTRVTGIAARTPLRVKLVAAMLGLLVVGLAVTGIAAWAAMRSYLVSQVDSDVLRAASAGFGPGIEHVRLADLTAADCGNQGGAGGTRYAFQLRNATGTWACGATDQGLQSSPLFPRWTASSIRDNAPVVVTVGSAQGSGSWRLTGSVLQGDTVFLVAESLNPVQHTLGQLILIEVLGGALVVLLLGGLSYALVRRSLRPLVEVEEAAEDIAAGDLSRRVPELDPATEVGRLSRSFNAMVDRIEAAFRASEESEAEAKASEERMRRFVADASHELRTPLTSIRGFAELYRQGAVPDPAAISRVMRRIEDQATRMGLLVEDLLLLARLDQQRPLDMQPVDLLTIASEAVQDARALEPDRQVSLVVADHEPPPVVNGDETRLRQVVGNLMSNALTHTPPGTPVTVSVRTDGEFGRLDVTDEGPGLSPDDAAHVFERFYRADSSRTRTSGGTGLGLSIAAALVATHAGRLSVETDLGHGATFMMRIPLAPAPTQDAASDTPAEAEDAPEDEVAETP